MWKAFDFLVLEEPLFTRDLCHVRSSQLVGTDLFGRAVSDVPDAMSLVVHL